MKFYEKQNRGFTLLEVMVALAIIAIMATTVLGVQMTMMRTTRKSTELFERLWHMASFMRRSGLESTVPEPDSFEKKEKISNPDLELVFTAKKPTKNSVLYEYEDLFLERVDANWTNGQNKKERDSLITFVYRPKISKKKKGPEKDEKNSDKKIDVLNKAQDVKK